MENLSFDALNAQWNQLRRSRSDLNPIVMQRVGESPDNITVMFRGFDTMTDQSPQLVKRTILQWVKRMAPVQISPGDGSSFILRIMKPVSTSTPATPQPAAQPAAPNMAESLTRISKVKKVYGH